MAVSGIFTIKGKDYTDNLLSLPFDSHEIKDLQIDLNNPLIKAIKATRRSKENKLRAALDVIIWESKTRVEQAFSTIPNPKTLLNTALATFGFATGNMGAGGAGVAGVAADFNNDVLENGYGVIDLFPPLGKEKEKEFRQNARKELLPILQNEIKKYKKQDQSDSSFLPNSFLIGTPFEGKEVVFYVLLLILSLWLISRLGSSK